MAEKKKKAASSDPYSEETVKRRRKFPKANTVVIFVLLAIQIIILTSAILYTPTPQDRIDRYELVAAPNADGTVDLTYTFVWTPLDTSEALTWVEIGMPNAYFDFDPSSYSSNISSCQKYIDDEYVSAQIYLDRAYSAGETLTFTFRVRQHNLLCRDGDRGYFYEFVPGWFNATPVDSYRFVWKCAPLPVAGNHDTSEGDDLVWEGAMPCGTYVCMHIGYDSDAFVSAPTTQYEEFYDGDVYDSLESDKFGAVLMAVLVSLLLLAIQIYMIDSVVSYHRGRGFLTGYGHHIHIYGRTNPKYENARDEHQASHGGGRSGGGCACACACACAGGGRAGCSQKDTTAVSIRKKNET